MSPVSVFCPNCGAAVEFRYDDTFVRVCAYCNAVVARGDRGFDMLGRMGDLAASESPLALNLVGQVGGVRFELVGRAQIAHPRGGGWEEWYARFDNGEWGWLSEAQGRFQLSFAAQLPALPPFETLAPGGRLPLALPGRAPENFTVSEVGAAAYRAAAGEMPYRLEPGLRFRYADLSGDRGGFATIDAGVDAGDEVALYIGREVSLAELGIAAAAPAERAPAPGAAPARTVSAHHVACVQCGGSLELRAPDATQRVTCPYCAALLDVSQGHLSYLRTLEKGVQTVKPDIPLGSTAQLDGHDLTVIGCLQRAVNVDAVDYPFTEYLLYHPAAGYRWLVESDGQWSYVTPLAAGAVTQTMNSAMHGKRRFRHFQSATAQVDAIFGELTWKVEIGEKAAMTDYVSPPYMLSCETSEGEINWSLGLWMQSVQLSARIRPPGGEPGSLALPSARTVAPHEPFRHRGILKLTLVLAGILLVAGLAMNASAADREIPLSFETPAPPATDPGASLGGAQPASIVHFSQPFELDAGKNVAVRFETRVDNSWLYIEGDLVNEDTGMVDSFDAALEHYSGTEGGEAWSEGDERKTVYLAAVPAGHYVLRLESQWPSDRSTPPLEVTLRQGVFRPAHLLVALGALLFIPLLVGLGWFYFEKRRWAESDHPWFESSDE